MFRFFGSLLLVVLLASSCQQQHLRTVSVSDFKQFVKETQYVTDAERYGWSVKQVSIHKYEVLDSLNWRLPDGVNAAKEGYAVTQVSYNDARAYAQWSDSEIPTYDEYWKLVAEDSRLINETSTGILPIDQVNIVGNVWDITQPDELGRIRLAGGSYLCDKNTCNGTSADRELYVDVETGNIHIGFSVIEKTK